MRKKERPAKVIAAAIKSEQKYVRRFSGFFNPLPPLVHFSHNVSVLSYANFLAFIPSLGVYRVTTMNVTRKGRIGRAD